MLLVARGCCMHVFLVRGIIILHEGNYLERPVQLVCPLEIRSVVKEDKENHNGSTKENISESVKRPERRAAKIAKENIKEQLQDE